MGRSIYPSGTACFLGTMPWKGAPVGWMRLVDAHGIEHFSVHDVEAAASIHQHLGELLHVDDRVNHKRISSRLRDAFRVVGLIKGYGGLRPSEEGRRGWLDRIDLTARKLLVALGVIGR